MLACFYIHRHSVVFAKFHGACYLNHSSIRNATYLGIRRICVHKTYCNIYIIRSCCTLHHASTIKRKVKCTHYKPFTPLTRNINIPAQTQPPLPPQKRYILRLDSTNVTFRRDDLARVSPFLFDSQCK